MSKHPFWFSFLLTAGVVGILLWLPTSGIDRQISKLSDLPFLYSPFDLSGGVLRPVVARIFDRIADVHKNACGVDLEDVVTLDERYTLHWICGGDQAPCTIFRNNKVFSQVHGGGSLQLKISEPATLYTIKNRDNQSCGFQIAHKFQAPGKNAPTGSGDTVASSTLYAITYTAESDFEQAVIDHTELYDGITIATTTILANDANATTALRTAIADIISFTSDQTLTAAEEESLSTDGAALAALGAGLELVKVTVASSSESFIWIREDDSVKDTVVNVIFRVANYKTITGGSASQFLLLGSPHWDDDSNTLLFPLRELVRNKNARALIIGTTDKSKLNPTGTGADASTSDDTSALSGGTAFCTGVTNSPGFLLGSDIGTYYSRNIAGSGNTDALYLIPYGGGCSPPTHIFSDTTSPGLFDNPRGFTFVGSARKMMVADRAGEEFWCFALESDGTYSSSTAVTRTDLTDALFEADSIAASPNGLVLYVVDDPDLNVNTTDNKLLRFDIDADCNVSTSFTTVASSRGEIDNLFFDAQGNVIFTEDEYTDEGETDIYYINNAQGGDTTIAQLVDGDSRVLAEALASSPHKLDDVTVNAITLTSSDRGLGSGNILLTDDTGDEIYTFVITRNSDGTISGLERTKLTDFSATTFTVEGLAMDDTDQDLIIFQEDSSDVGTFYQLSNYNEMIVDTNNFTDVSRIVGYQTIVEEFAEDLNTIHWQWHGYRESDWTITTCGANAVNPWTVSDGVNSSTKNATFTYLEDLVSDYMTGYNGCSSDFIEIFPGAQVALGAQTNKQGEFLQTLNSTIGIDTNDIFMQSELPFDVRAGGDDLDVHGTDASNRYHDAHDAF
ncbi:MAG: hypothetical protein G01um101419_55 [Parcubacteria group bacterium Gr01-1014_19]|nr:MAG: hypothetical protein G01um101419_55 [Parcubacteria group bacterium Gr01-1014_19]